MSKIESNKIQKRNSLLSTAFHLFTTKGVNQTSIAEISEQAGIAKGTFYLYFKDKYDIRNKLISHEASKLFMAASAALEKRCPGSGTKMSFEDKIVFIVDYIIEALNQDKTLLNFISKNLSWGIFKEALTTNVAEEDVNFKDAYYEMLAAEETSYNEPEIMLFLITELVSSTSYSSILYGEPADIETLKPYIITTVRSIIESHIKKE
jgi:AcrR family transcriptional regulator